MNFDAVLDGEMLVLRDGDVMPFNELQQQRLNRKTGDREDGCRNTLPMCASMTFWPKTGEDLRRLQLLTNGG